MSDSDEFPRRRGEGDSPGPSEPRRTRQARWFRSQFLIGVAIALLFAFANPFAATLLANLPK